MPLLAGDIRFARSANMTDVPEGGGPPSAQLLTSGASNEIFPDISEETRTVGRVEIYQIFGLLRNLDRAPLLGANVIIAEPPADPGVSITMLSLKDPFATRRQIAARIESGMVAGSEWAGYLLEDHFTTMRSIQLFQRPGMAAPGVGKTFVLTYREGESGERRQRVRIKNVDTTTRLFTELGANLDSVTFEGQVSTCELFDALQYDFPGSPPSRRYARQDPLTRVTSRVRETIYSDSGMFYGATRLNAACQINDNWLRLDDVYTQIVPNSRTEAASVDQRPAAQRTLVLAETPRRIEVGITPHTQRLKIGEENAGLVFVFQCRPYPSPGTLTLSYRTMGTWYTLTDDGQGAFTGSGSGSVNYLTGSLAITLRSVPDIGSSLVLSWGENTAFTNRAGSAAFRLPEHSWMLPKHPVKPGTVVVTWTSAGQLHTLTDDGVGGLHGSGGAGAINYGNGWITVSPTKLLDAGGEYETQYVYSSLQEERFAAVTPDAGGFATLTLAEQPVPRSIKVDWYTVRNVSATSGSTELVSESAGTSSETQTFFPAPAPQPQPSNPEDPEDPGFWAIAVDRFASPPSGYASADDVFIPGDTVLLRVTGPHLALGAHPWVIRGPAGMFAATSGTVDMHQVGNLIRGSISLPVSTDSPPTGALWYTVTIHDGDGTALTDVGFHVYSYSSPPPVVPTAPVQPPTPVDYRRDDAGITPQPQMTVGGRHPGAGQSGSQQSVVILVEPTKKDPYGYVYDGPADRDAQWTQAELDAGRKTMLSQAGVLTTYRVWG